MHPHNTQNGWLSEPPFPLRSTHSETQNHILTQPQLYTQPQQPHSQPQQPFTPQPYSQPQQPFTQLQPHTDTLRSVVSRNMPQTTPHLSQSRHSTILDSYSSHNANTRHVLNTNNRYATVSPLGGGANVESTHTYETPDEVQYVNGMGNVGGTEMSTHNTHTDVMFGARMHATDSHHTHNNNINRINNSNNNSNNHNNNNNNNNNNTNSINNNNSKNNNNNNHNPNNPHIIPYERVDTSNNVDISVTYDQAVEMAVMVIPNFVDIMTELRNVEKAAYQISTHAHTLQVSVNTQVGGEHAQTHTQTPTRAHTHAHTHTQTLRRLKRIHHRTHMLCVNVLARLRLLSTERVVSLCVNRDSDLDISAVVQLCQDFVNSCLECMEKLSAISRNLSKISCVVDIDSVSQDYVDASILDDKQGYGKKVSYESKNQGLGDRAISTHTVSHTRVPPAPEHTHNTTLHSYPHTASTNGAESVGTRNSANPVFPMMYRAFYDRTVHIVAGVWQRCVLRLRCTLLIKSLRKKHESSSSRDGGDVTDPLISAIREQVMNQPYAGVWLFSERSDVCACLCERRADNVPLTLQRLLYQVSVHLRKSALPKILNISHKRVSIARDLGKLSYGDILNMVRTNPVSGWIAEYAKNAATACIGNISEPGTDNQSSILCPGYQLLQRISTECSQNAGRMVGVRVCVCALRDANLNHMYRMLVASCRPTLLNFANAHNVRDNKMFGFTSQTLKSTGLYNGLWKQHPANNALVEYVPLYPYDAHIGACMCVDFIHIPTDQTTTNSPNSELNGDSNSAHNSANPGCSKYVYRIVCQIFLDETPYVGHKMTSISQNSTGPADTNGTNNHNNRNNHVRGLWNGKFGDIRVPKTVLRRYPVSLVTAAGELCKDTKDGHSTVTFGIRHCFKIPVHPSLRMVCEVQRAVHPCISANVCVACRGKQSVRARKYVSARNGVVPLYIQKAISPEHSQDNDSSVLRCMGMRECGHPHGTRDGYAPQNDSDRQQNDVESGKKDTFTHIQSRHSIPYGPKSEGVYDFNNLRWEAVGHTSFPLLVPRERYYPPCTQSLYASDERNSLSSVQIGDVSNAVLSEGGDFKLNTKVRLERLRQQKAMRQARNLQTPQQIATHFLSQSKPRKMTNFLPESKESEHQDTPISLQQALVDVSYASTHSKTTHHTINPYAHQLRLNRGRWVGKCINGPASNELEKYLKRIRGDKIDGERGFMWKNWYKPSWLSSNDDENDEISHEAAASDDNVRVYLQLWTLQEYCGQIRSSDDACIDLSVSSHPSCDKPIENIRKQKQYYEQLRMVSSEQYSSFCGIPSQYPRVFAKEIRHAGTFLSQCMARTLVPSPYEQSASGLSHSEYYWSIVPRNTAFSYTPFPKYYYIDEHVDQLSPALLHNLSSQPNYPFHALFKFAKTRSRRRVKVKTPSQEAKPVKKPARPAVTVTVSEDPVEEKSPLSVEKPHKSDVKPPSPLVESKTPTSEEEPVESKKPSSKAISVSLTAPKQVSLQPAPFVLQTLVRGAIKLGTTGGNMSARVKSSGRNTSKSLRKMEDAYWEGGMSVVVPLGEQYIPKPIISAAKSGVTRKSDKLGSYTMVDYLQNMDIYVDSARFLPPSTLFSRCVLRVWSCERQQFVGNSMLLWKPMSVLSTERVHFPRYHLRAEVRNGKPRWDKWGVKVVTKPTMPHNLQTSQQSTTAETSGVKVNEFGAQSVEYHANLVQSYGDKDTSSRNSDGVDDSLIAFVRVDAMSLEGIWDVIGFSFINLYCIAQSNQIPPSCLPPAQDTTSHSSASNDIEVPLSQLRVHVGNFQLPIYTDLQAFALKKTHVNMMSVASKLPCASVLVRIRSCIDRKGTQIKTTKGCKPKIWGQKNMIERGLFPYVKICRRPESCAGESSDSMPNSDSNDAFRRASTYVLGKSDRQLDDKMRDEESKTDGDGAMDTSKWARAFAGVPFEAPKFTSDSHGDIVVEAVKFDHAVVHKCPVNSHKQKDPWHFYTLYNSVRGAPLQEEEQHLFTLLSQLYYFYGAEIGTAHLSSKSEPHKSHDVPCYFHNSRAHHRAMIGSSLCGLCAYRKLVGVLKGLETLPPMLRNRCACGAEFGTQPPKRSHETSERNERGFSWFRARQERAALEKHAPMFNGVEMWIASNWYPSLCTNNPPIFRAHPPQSITHHTVAHHNSTFSDSISALFVPLQGESRALPWYMHDGTFKDRCDVVTSGLKKQASNCHRSQPLKIAQTPQNMAARVYLCRVGNVVRRASLSVSVSVRESIERKHNHTDDNNNHGTRDMVNMQSFFPPSSLSGRVSLTSFPYDLDQGFSVSVDCVHQTNVLNLPKSMQKGVDYVVYGIYCAGKVGGTPVYTGNRAGPAKEVIDEMRRYCALSTAENDGDHNKNVCYMASCSDIDVNSMSNSPRFGDGLKVFQGLPSQIHEQQQPQQQHAKVLYPLLVCCVMRLFRVENTDISTWKSVCVGWAVFPLFRRMQMHGIFRHFSAREVVSQRLTLGNALLRGSENASRGHNCSTVSIRTGGYVLPVMAGRPRWDVLHKLAHTHPNDMQAVWETSLQRSENGKFVPIAYSQGCCVVVRIGCEMSGCLIPQQFDFLRLRREFLPHKDAHVGRKMFINGLASCLSRPHSLHSETVRESVQQLIETSSLSGMSEFWKLWAEYVDRWR